MAAALELCPQDTSIHDAHLFKTLIRMNASFMRHPFAADFVEKVRAPFHFGERVHASDGYSLARAIVPSLLETLAVASASGGILTTRAFMRAWALQCIANGASKSRRSHLFSGLLGAADTSHGGLCDAPEVERFLTALAEMPEQAEDVEYVLTLAGDRLALRPTSVLHDYVQETALGRPAPTRAILTHFRDRFGLILEDELSELDALLNDPRARELQFQRFFVDHPNFLRINDYREVIAQPYLAHREQSDLVPDFLLTNKELSRATILDLKLPRAKLVRRQANRDRFSAALMEARAQLLRYQEWFRDADNRRRLASVVGMEIYEPRLAVIIGRASEFHDEFDRQRLVAQTPDLEVLTYDDILARARARRILLRD